MILVFIDQAEGKIKKASLEALTYGAAIAVQTGVAAEAIILGSTGENLAELGKYGVSKIHHTSDVAFNTMDAQVYAKAISDAASKLGATVVVFSHNQTGKAVASRVSAALKAGMVAGAVALPDISNGFTVKKAVFSGKAFAHIAVKTAVKVISLNPNSFYIKADGTGDATVESLSPVVQQSRIKVTGVNKVSGEVPLTEAEVVVSGGRGLKGPENWGLVEDLAKVLHAATACSRPVADAHWRPHHEHVGQTGFQIAPNLYFAIGISGAIQHLAGVNRSKTIVVINKDPEAPFFKAADYGVVGDAFEVVPRLTAEIKKLKGIS